ncbi:MAG: FecR domain-containing protein [Myxococcaceae bacterium]|nr:FecR domain-containing protein [Myxococcaceae bacterium]
MAAHESARLWDYARGRLSGADAEAVRAHVASCPSCAEALAAARVAVDALPRLGPPPRAPSEWKALDNAVLERARAALQPGPWDRLRDALSDLFTPRWTLGAAVFAAMMVAVVLWRPEPATPPSHWTAQVISTPGADVALVEGSQVQNDADGEVVLRLPEGSALAVRAGSSARLASLDASRIRLEVDRGEIVVAATHRDQRTFEVVAGGAIVRVVGTRFSVARTLDGTIVRVTEGKVEVTAHGQTTPVSAGEELTVTPTATKKRSLADEIREELAPIIEKLQGVIRPTPGTQRRVHAPQPAPGDPIHPAASDSARSAGSAPAPGDHTGTAPAPLPGSTAPSDRAEIASTAPGGSAPTADHGAASSAAAQAGSALAPNNPAATIASTAPDDSAPAERHRAATPAAPQAGSALAPSNSGPVASTAPGDSAPAERHRAATSAAPQAGSALAPNSPAATIASTAPGDSAPAERHRAATSAAPQAGSALAPNNPAATIASTAPGDSAPAAGYRATSSPTRPAGPALAPSSPPSIASTAPGDSAPAERHRAVSSPAPQDGSTFAPSSPPSIASTASDGSTPVASGHAAGVAVPPGGDDEWALPPLSDAGTSRPTTPGRATAQPPTERAERDPGKQWIRGAVDNVKKWLDVDWNAPFPPVGMSMMEYRVRQMEHLADAGSCKRVLPRADAWVAEFVTDAGTPPDLELYRTVELTRARCLDKLGRHEEAKKVRQRWNGR